MAETTTKTAQPRKPRTRATATRSAPTKAAPAKAASVDAEAPELAAAETYIIDLQPHESGPTKSYSRWVAPEGSGCVGTVYAPLGTPAVQIVLSTGE